MARKRFVPIVAVLMLAGSALLALLGFYVVRDARVTLSKVTAQKVFITETLQTFQKQVAGRKIDKNQASSMIGQSATVPGKAADKKGDEYRPHRPDPMVALKASPQLFSMYMQQYRASLQVYYGVAFRVLGLTSDQISKFHDLMCEHEEKRVDLITAGSLQGLSPSDPTLTQMTQESASQLQDSLVALLGTSGYQEYQQLSPGKPLLSIFHDLSCNFAWSPTPLTTQQLRQLAPILEKAVTGGKGWAAVNWDVALPQVQGILTSEQLEVAKTSIAGQDLNQAVREYYSQLHV